MQIKFTCTLNMIAKTMAGTFTMNGMCKHQESHTRINQVFAQPSACLMLLKLSLFSFKSAIYKIHQFIKATNYTVCFLQHVIEYGYRIQLFSHVYKTWACRYISPHPAMLSNKQHKGALSFCCAYQWNNWWIMAVWCSYKMGTTWVMLDIIVYKV